MNDEAELLNAFAAHRRQHGATSARAIVAEFADGSDDTDDVPEGKRAECLAALRGRESPKAKPPTQFSELDTTAIWNRFNAAGRARDA